MGEAIEREDLNTISMQVILHAGNARDLAMQIMALFEECPLNKNKVQELSKQARSELTLAHNQQTDILQIEANGGTIPYSVLFIHAQDTLMTIQSELLLIEKFVPIINKLGGKNDGQTNELDD